MPVIDINTSSGYSVFLGKGMLDSAAELISPLIGKHGGRIMVVSDSSVYPLYGENLKTELKKTGAEIYEYVFPAGENSKSLLTVEKLWGELAGHSFSRSDMLIALGGGVTGDITGFAASAYLRGIRYVQIPTTLLAMVDSSVGGKTAVNIAQGKNMIGAFWQPSLVICDTATLDTLSEEVFNDGMAEVIKYAMIDSDEIRELIMSEKPDIEKTVELSVCSKKEKVEADERDKGRRKLLNFGHTAGHAIEALSRYTVSHGRAVAIGMALITKESISNGICEPETLDILKAMLNRYSLPAECEYELKDICSFAVNDKKREGNRICLIVPEKAGKCYIKEISVGDYIDYIKKL